jgi:predicted Zn finger-like uncharacterized protein
MFTVCPKCALTLVVTAEDLRVAQGYVRCGRCSSVFNALARLTEERGAPEAAAPPAPPPAAQTPAAPARPQRPGLAPSALDEDAISEDALEFDPAKTDVSSVFVEPPPNPQWTAATGTFKAMLAANEMAHPEEAAPVETHGTDAPEEPAPPADPDGDVDVELDPELLASILQADATPRAAPESAPAAPVTQSPPAAAAAPRTETASRAVPARPRPPPPAPPPPAPPARAPAVARGGAPPPPPTSPSPPHLPPRQAQAPPSVPAGLEAPTSFLGRRRTAAAAGDESWQARLGWPAAATLALLLLLGQIVNHHRDELAANARFNRPLTALYASLGVHLLPRWDLHAYDVRQLGASVEAGGSGLITVRASIKNSAPQPQPLPLLRVTLQDRFGNRIAARDVGPPSYLARPAPAPTFLSAGERIDAEMGFVDPGANAVGFEIDACLPTSGGEVTCAGDAAPR